MKTLIICEGPSEQLFLEELKRQDKIKTEFGITHIILFKSWNLTRRIKTVYKGYDKIILIHDSDDLSLVKKHTDFFDEHIGKVIFNRPNFDYFCGEYLNLKWNKDDKRDVLRQISKIIKSKNGKKLDYKEFLKKGDIKNINNLSNYRIIDLMK